MSKETRQAKGAWKHAMYGTNNRAPIDLLVPQNCDRLVWDKLSVGSCRKCSKGAALWYGLCRECRQRYIRIAW